MKECEVVNIVPTYTGGSHIPLRSNIQMVKGTYRIFVYEEPKVKIDPIKVVLHVPDPKLKGQQVTCKNIKSKDLGFSLIPELQKKLEEEICLKLGFVNNKCVLKVNQLWVDKAS